MEASIRPALGERLQVIPRRYKYAGADAVFWLTSRLFRGEKVACAVCGQTARRWISLGFPHLLCPHCGSFERQRMLSLYLKNHTALGSSPMRVLHFAPEYCFLRHFPDYPDVAYIPTDLFDPPAGARRIDVTNIDLDSGSVDLIICSHVLEHVPAEGRAMRELRRVLRPGGQALILVPIDFSRARTYEDPLVVTPRARREAFGQGDHVRIYGRDFGDRLRAAGFKVAENSYARGLEEQAISRLGLTRDEVVYVCT